MNTAVFHEVMSCSMAPVCHATRRHFPQKGIIHSYSYVQLKSLYVHYISSSLYEVTQPCHSTNNERYHIHSCKCWTNV